MAKREKSDSGVYRVTEIIGTSTVSWEDAATSAVETAAKSLRDLRVAEVSKLDMKVEDGKVVAYRAPGLTVLQIRSLTAGPRRRHRRRRRETGTRSDDRSAYSALRSRIRRRSARSAASSHPDWFGMSSTRIGVTRQGLDMALDALEHDRLPVRGTHVPSRLPAPLDRCVAIQFHRRLLLALDLAFPILAKNRPGHRPQLRPPSHREGVLMWAGGRLYRPRREINFVLRRSGAYACRGETAIRLCRCRPFP